METSNKIILIKTAPPSNVYVNSWHARSLTHKHERDGRPRAPLRYVTNSVMVRFKVSFESHQCAFVDLVDLRIVGYSSNLFHVSLKP